MQANRCLQFKSFASIIPIFMATLDEKKAFHRFSLVWSLDVPILIKFAYFRGFFFRCVGSLGLDKHKTVRRVVMIAFDSDVDMMVLLIGGKEGQISGLRPDTLSSVCLLVLR